MEMVIQLSVWFLFSSTCGTFWQLFWELKQLGQPTLLIAKVPRSPLQRWAKQAELSSVLTGRCQGVFGLFQRVHRSLQRLMEMLIKLSKRGSYGSIDSANVYFSHHKYYWIIYTYNILKSLNEWGYNLNFETFIVVILKYNWEISVWKPIIFI